MESFDQLIELAHEARDSYENFLKTNLNVSVDKAFMNYYKSREICKGIVDKMDKIEIRQGGSSFGYDKCVYYMAKESLIQYQYAALLVFTRKQGEAFKQLVEKKAEEKQKESLKHLIKEAIKEAKEEPKSKPLKVKNSRSKSQS